MEKELKTIRILLTFLVVPLVVYILKLLSFIFIPLFFAFFFALLFSPVLRWLNDKKIPKTGSLAIVTLIIIVSLTSMFKIGQLATDEVLNTDQEFWNVAGIKINTLLKDTEQLLGIRLRNNDFKTIVQNKEVVDAVRNNLGSVVKSVQSAVTTILMTVFFLILLLTGSMNFQKVMHDTLFKSRLSSIKTFLRIEKSIVTFIKVKTVTSLFTGIGFGLSCYFFGVSFPLLWGLLAFLLNYIQLLGSLIVTALLTIFAFVEINSLGSLVLFGLLLLTVQIFFGSVLEPIFMGQSFKINTIVVLVMLMLWGYLWGIPGLVLSIPITVTVKTLLEQFPTTEAIAKILS
jgi:predicted PurR-regulated permease PerM